MSAHGIAAWKRRHSAAQRLTPLECVCRDPWPCRHHEANAEPSTLQVDAYRDTCRSLLSTGLLPAPRLPEMRALWRRGGEERELAQEISLRWEVAV